MNLMGKIFTLLIFFLSITFLVLAVMVGASHRNWKAIAADNKDKATLASERLEQSRASSNEFQRRLNAEQVSRQQQLAHLFAQTEILQKRLDKEAAENHQKGEEHAKLLTDNNNATLRLKVQDKEVDTLKASNKNLIDDIASQRESVVSLTSTIYELRGQIRALEQNSQDLSSLLAQQQQAMKHAGITVNTPTDHIPTPLEGVVTRREDDFIAVSLGTDDGLRVGHSLDVYRNDRYVGRATVTRAEDNMSAARLIPEYQRTLVREGDYVTTKF